MKENNVWLRRVLNDIFRKMSEKTNPLKNMQRTQWKCNYHIQRIAGIINLFLHHSGSFILDTIFMVIKDGKNWCVLYFFKVYALKENYNFFSLVYFCYIICESLLRNHRMLEYWNFSVTVLINYYHCKYIINIIIKYFVKSEKTLRI